MGAVGTPPAVADGHDHFAYLVGLCCGRGGNALTAAAIAVLSVSDCPIDVRHAGGGSTGNRAPA